MKKNIDLIVNGVKPEKVMYDTDNHSLVVLYPKQKEFKKGDKVRLKKNLNLKIGKWYNGLTYIKEIDNVKDAILTIDRVSGSNGSIKAYNNIDGGWWWYRSEWLEHIVEDEVKFKRGDVVYHNNIVSIFGTYTNSAYEFHGLYNVLLDGSPYYIGRFDNCSTRLATPEEQQTLFDALKKEGKKWNAETLQVEDLDISDIVIDLNSACDYLKIKRPSNFILDEACERSNKFEAQMELQLIREAWNKFDEFEVDCANSEQGKYFPVLDVCGDINFIASWGTTHISASCLSFPTPERALQFGKQFKELFKTAMGI